MFYEINTNYHEEDTVVDDLTWHEWLDEFDSIVFEEFGVDHTDLTDDQIENLQYMWNCGETIFEAIRETFYVSEEFLDHDSHLDYCEESAE